MVFLCFSLVSCSTTQKNNQDEIKQVQPELKHQTHHDNNRSIGDKIEQQDRSSQVNNRHEKNRPQGIQQITNTGNYSSEIKSARTSREKATQLEGKLDASLRDFDEMLLKKNEALSSVQSRQEEGLGGSGSASQGGDNSFGEYEYNSESASAQSGSGQGNAGPMSQNKEFSNDDVVARQIREAAEKETDPELKKKLWAEYKKYKAGNK